MPGWTELAMNAVRIVGAAAEATETKRIVIDGLTAMDEFARAREVLSNTEVADALNRPGSTETLVRGLRMNLEEIDSNVSKHAKRILFSSEDSGAVPKVLELHPSMEPYEGKRYIGEGHRKLMILTECPYLPKGEGIDSDDWHRATDEDLYEAGKLSKEGKRWLNFRRNVVGGQETGNWLQKTYVRLNDLMNVVLQKEGANLDHVVYCNYFDRPAVHGVPLRLGLMDIKSARESFRWKVDYYTPDVVVVLSSKAAPHVPVNELNKRGIEVFLTEHPMATRTRRGPVGAPQNRDDLIQFLREKWLRSATRPTGTVFPRQSITA